MAIDFPNSPTSGQRFASGEVTWTYDGSKWNLTGSTTAFAPVGTIISYTGTYPPNGWLRADGASVLRSSYPTLFGLIGTTFGAGSVPGTTFALPDYRGTTGIFIIRATDDSVALTTSASLIGVPVGSLQLFAMTSVPTGWVRADGAAFSRTTYADLFASIGTTYGTGDGSTTFNVPNISGAGTGSPLYYIKSILSGDVQPSTVAHAASHIRGGSDVIDADRDQIDFVPTYYTRDSSPAQAGASTDLTAHLKGIDNKLFVPRFFVANEGGAAIAAPNKHTWNIVITNVNSCWSAPNNRFTAPIAGDYFFSYSILNSAAGAFYVEFRKNGTAMAAGTYPRGYTSLIYTANTASGILTLNATDYIEIWVTAGTAHSYHSFFTGYLIF